MSLVVNLICRSCPAFRRLSFATTTNLPTIDLISNYDWEQDEFRCSIRLSPTNWYFRSTRLGQTGKFLLNLVAFSPGRFWGYGREFLRVLMWIIRVTSLRKGISHRWGGINSFLRCTRFQERDVIGCSSLWRRGKNGEGRGSLHSRHIRYIRLRAQQRGSIKVFMSRLPVHF